MRYQITQDWQGDTVCILGGGPSLANVDLSCMPSDWRVIAINEAGLTKAPEADVLFFGDFRWYQWNKGRLKFYMGQETITRGYDYMYPDHIKVARWDRDQAIHKSANAIGGWCSGGSAIDLAYKRGADKIILLGFDMNDKGKANWHDAHKEPATPNSRRDHFIPSLERASEALKEAGVTVINATPKSKLTCFEFAPWEDLCLSR